MKDSKLRDYPTPSQSEYPQVGMFDWTRDWEWVRAWGDNYITYYTFRSKRTGKEIALSGTSIEDAARFLRPDNERGD